MRRLFFLSVIVWTLSIGTGLAQSYSSLWKQVTTAEEKDQPKSALEAISKIERKAEKEQDYGNLLAAMVKELSMQREIAPDSLIAAKNRLKAKQEAWRKNGHGVEATLAQVAVHSYSQAHQASQSQFTVHSFVDSLMASPDSALYRKAGKAHGYSPLIEKGVDSHYFNNDLLSLIIMANDRGKTTTDLLEKYYGKENKVVMWRRLLEYLQEERSTERRIATIDKALTEWKGWKEYAELQNRRRELTLPQYRARIDKNIVSTADKVVIYFTNVRNLEEVRVNLNANPNLNLNFTHKFEKKKEWEFIEKDSIVVGKLPYGKYKLSFTPNPNDNDKENYLYVTNMKVIEIGQPKDKIRCVVVDVETGKPVPGATVYYRNRENHYDKQVYTTDENGGCTIQKKKLGHYDYYTFAIKGGDKMMPAQPISTYYQSWESEKVKNYLDLYTDRAIYRRGQTVHVTAICHTVLKGKETLASPREMVILTLRDRKYKKVAEKTVVTDEYGTATADFVIPEEGENGTYNIEARGSDRSSVAVKVEDYKRPTYEVKIDNVNVNGNVNQDTTLVTGTAKMYSGVPVANARVAVDVRRVFGFWYRSSGEQLMKDTIYTDADGRFQIKAPTTLPEKVDTTWYYCYRYIVKAVVTDSSGESHSKSITLTRENNRPQKPQEPEKPSAVTCSAKTFNAENSPVIITLRDNSPERPNDQTTKRPIFAHYSICAGDSVMENGMLQFTDSTTYSLRYKEEYGDGVIFAVAWMKDGKMFSKDLTIKKYLPSKALTMEWGTFRDKLYPGQTETWTMKVKGQGSKVQVMAVMYDKSLDALMPNKWELKDNRLLHTPQTGWNTARVSSRTFWYNKEMKWTPYDNLTYNAIDGEYRFQDWGYRIFSGGPLMMAKSESVYETMAMADEAPRSVKKNVPIGSFNVTGSEAEEEEVEVRENFAETAFFFPQIETDAKGVATLKFTMPESVTTWKFMALAHDKEMRYALMDTTAITQKKIMVQARMPRFLRVGDKANISASIANLMEKNQRVEVSFVVKDARTEKVLHKDKKAVMTEAGRTANVTFPYDINKEGDVVCTFLAKIPGFSDGEQHLLPILTEKDMEADTAAIVVNPRKMLMEALPELQVPKTLNAITLVHAMYANVMAAKLKDTIVSPANDNVLVQLLKLQREDGGFAWYSGMQSSKYITIEVLKTLARMNLMCGTQQNTAHMMDKAFAFAETAMEEEREWMRKHDYKYLSYSALDWLYTLAISGRSGGATERYFRKMIYEETKHDDMQTKAVAAITLNENGKKKQAGEFVESIKQHTVYRADMGRYFDSYRAAYSWCSYRIPTQTSCIEAMKDITPEDVQTISEMQRWIVSSKRTQRWDNPINTVNAIYALHDTKDTTMLATYTVKPEDLQGALTVTRKLSSKGSAMKVGDKVKVTLTIEADRDYDFVTVTYNRPACLEPVNQLSGYSWYGFWGCYAEMRDTKSVYHFDKMAKGRHVVETEYYIDREGEYQEGNATVVCEYAPEFRGEAKGGELKIKN